MPVIGVKRLATLLGGLAVSACGLRDGAELNGQIDRMAASSARAVAARLATGTGGDAGRLTPGSSTRRLRWRCRRRGGCSPQLRVSEMGPDGSAAHIAQFPQVAYNSRRDQYLVVWQGNAGSFCDGTLADDEVEIWAQRVDARSGRRRGAPIRVSRMGPDGDARYGAFNPQVTYNPVADEYLVAWWGDDNRDFGGGALADDEYEIWAQRIGGNGKRRGENLRVSQMGPDGRAEFDAVADSFDPVNPRLQFNPDRNEYLVVWIGDHQVDGEFEVWAQRVAGGSGALRGAVIQVSDMGPDGDPTYHVARPQVAYNTVNRQYFVVWQGSDNSDFGAGPLGAREPEIFGQRIDGEGNEIGGDFRISDMGNDGDVAYDAFAPRLAYNARDNEFLVVWVGDDDSDYGNGALVPDEYEVWAQRIDGATGAELGSDIRVSRMGPDGSSDYKGYAPVVVYNRRAHVYLVVWQGSDDGRFGDRPLASNEYEIWAQQLDARSGELKGDRVRVSEMGPDGDTGYFAAAQRVVYNAARNEYLVFWWGDHNGDFGKGALADDEYEIWARRLAGRNAQPRGKMIRVSRMGADGDPTFGAADPNFTAVAPQAAVDRRGHYFVVWWGDHGGDSAAGPLADDELEIWGRQLTLH